MEFDSEKYLNQHSQVHAEQVDCNLCEKKMLPRSMSRHVKMVHTITQDDNNFLRVLSKKRDIKCKLCNYTVKNLESEAHGEKKLKLVLHINGYNL